MGDPSIPHIAFPFYLEAFMNIKVPFCFTLINKISAEFATYHNYVRSLRFEEKPDYAYLRQSIRLVETAMII